MRITDEQFVRENLPVIPEEANKYTRGRLFLIAGSYGMAGALLMAAKAAFRSGAGFLDLMVPEKIYPVVTQAVPEAVCSVYDPADEADIRKKLLAGIEKADAVAIGPGLGILREKICPVVFENCRKPLLIDADAITFLAGMPEDLPVSDDTVLTPHEGEMGRLLSCDFREIQKDREGAARKASLKYRASVLLKGPDTLILSKEQELFLNPYRNAGLARAGSGDTLTGIIGSLMAQGMKGASAAAAGAYLHAEAGRIAREKLGVRSMLPSDLPDCLPEVFRKLNDADF